MSCRRASMGRRIIYESESFLAESLYLRGI